MPADTDSTLRRDHRPNAAAPIVAYGTGAIMRLPGHVHELGARRVLLVCGRRSFEASGASRVRPEIERHAVVRRWSDFVPNTDAADLQTGLRIMREFDPDLVLGIGGGTALDMAKLLAAYQDVADGEVLDAVRTGRKADSRRQRLVLVPTTSGSGAEATHFSVVYIGHDKFSISGEGMRPDAIVLDPALSVTGSPYQRATSGIDAICQAIESLWATAATDRSRFFARAALRVLVPAIERFVNDPDDTSARAMCIGSHLAGRAIDISRTTAAHALSYGITKTYGISHGHAVALTLGHFIRAHAEADSSLLNPEVDPEDHARAMGEVLAALSAADGVQGEHRFTQLLDRINLNPSLAAAGASTPDARRALAETVNSERLGNNPIRYSQADLHTFIEGVR
jgi:alcohol dehydrogenase